MIDDDLPPDPELDDLPDELRLHPGPFLIDGIEVTREQSRRRVRGQAAS